MTDTPAAGQDHQRRTLAPVRRTDGPPTRPRYLLPGPDASRCNDVGARWSPTARSSSLSTSPPPSARCR
jgi:hypothetical protein